MFDLQLLAFRADITRVFSMLTGRERAIGAPSRNRCPRRAPCVIASRDDPELVAKKPRSNMYHVALFPYFLEQLQAAPDGDGTLLDHSMILYGGGRATAMCTTTSICHDPWRAAARPLSGGPHVTYPDDTPMANLLLTLLDKAGVPTPEKIGDSTDICT